MLVMTLNLRCQFLPTIHATGPRIQNLDRCTRIPHALPVYPYRSIDLRAECLAAGYFVERDMCCVGGHIPCMNLLDAMLAIHMVLMRVLR